LGVVAFVGQPVEGFVAGTQHESLAGQLLFYFFEQQREDLPDIGFAERQKHHLLVDAVEKFGAQVFFQQVEYLGFGGGDDLVAVFSPRASRSSKFSNGLRRPYSRS
jgi:hypothetical protein